MAQVLGTLASPGARVLVTGEPGIGKTTVFQALLRAVDADWVWTVRCLDSERELGLAVLSDLLERIPEAVLDCLPGPQRRLVDVVLYRNDGAASDAAPGRLVAVTTLSVLRLLAACGSVLLAIDDLQWADRQSVSALTFALHRLTDDDVRVLATSRSSSPDVLPGADLVTLGPLAPVAAEAAVLAAAPRLSRAEARRIAARSGGNPFFARELARAAEQGAPDQLPASLSTALLRRVAALSPGSRRIVLDIAVRGVMPTDQCNADALHAARHADVVVEEDGRVRVAHPLLAAAVIENALPKHLRQAHARAARDATDPIARVLHRADSEPPSEALAVVLDEAADVAGRRGDRFGVQALRRRALDATPDGIRPVARLDALAVAELAVTNLGAAARLGAELQGLPTPPDVRARAAQYVTVVEPDHIVAADTVLSALATPDVSDHVRDDLMVYAGLRLWTAGQTVRAIAVYESALAAAADPARTMAGVVGLLSCFRRECGFAVDARLLARAVESERVVNRTPGMLGSYQGALGAAAYLAYVDDRHDDAAVLLAETEEAAATHDDVNWVASYPGLLQLRRGDLDAAAQALDDANDLYGSVIDRANAALVRVWQGDTAYALEQLDRIDPEIVAGTDRRTLNRDYVRGLLDVLSGEPERAWHRLAPAAEFAEAIALREPSDPPVLALAAEAAAHAGELEAAGQLCTRLERNAAATGSRFGHACARRVRGLIAQARGDHDAAIGELSSSSAAFSHIEVGLEAARTRLLLGAALRRAGQRRRAREELQAALGAFTTAGAAHLVEEAEAELGRIGGRAARTETGELTASEQQVLALVVTGARNADIARTLHLSVKTVETHLSRVYRKLNVTNRTELTKLTNASP